MKCSRNIRKRNRGSLIADAPLALWILFIGLCFPLLNMATITLRSNFLNMAARDAAWAASKAKSFRTPVDASSPSAEQTATNQVATTASKFSEVTVTSTTTYISYTNIASGQTWRVSAPLTTPPDTALFIYSIEVQVVGRVSPIITYNGGYFGNIPGFTGPITTTCVAREYCEYPQGLTQ